MPPFITEFLNMYPLSAHRLFSPFVSPSHKTCVSNAKAVRCVPEKQKQPEGCGTELTVVPNRRGLLRSAGLAGAGLLGVGSTSVNVVAAGRTTAFVEATYTHTVTFGERTDVSIPRSQVSIDTQPSYVTQNGHDTLRIRIFADRDTRDYIKNSDRLTKVSLGPFERHPAQDDGPRPMSRVVMNVLGDRRPVTT